jgi:hypothetical protein
MAQTLDIAGAGTVGMAGTAPRSACSKPGAAGRRFPRPRPELVCLGDGHRSLMMTRHDTGHGDAFGGWLMPVVPPMVSAANGALLIPHVAPSAFGGQGRLTLLLACYAMVPTLWPAVRPDLVELHLPGRDVRHRHDLAGGPLSRGRAAGASVFLFGLLLVAWLVVASRTVSGVVTGRLFPAAISRALSV